MQTPVALTIAGSDSSAGAGIQADLKTLNALGVYGVSAVTCIVAEIPGKVSRIEPISAEMVREQIKVIVKNFPIGAVKTGLLCSAEIVSAVAKSVVDLVFANGKVTEFAAPFVRDVATHGTGCTYSAAITAGLAAGMKLKDAIERAKKFVTDCIVNRIRWESEAGGRVDALRHSPMSD